MCLEDKENCFGLDHRVFANNNVKVHDFMTILTLLTLQGSVHT